MQVQVQEEEEEEEEVEASGVKSPESTSKHRNTAVSPFLSRSLAHSLTRSLTHSLTHSHSLIGFSKIANTHPHSSNRG